MNRGDEILLTRWLAGEGDEAERRAFAARLAAEPALARAAAARRATWEALSLPPAAPPPPGFAGRVASRARTAGDSALFAGAPAWARGLAAAALVAGILAGAGLGRATWDAGTATTEDPLGWDDASGLADGYLDALDAVAALETGTASGETP